MHCHLLKPELHSRISLVASESFVHENHKKQVKPLIFVLDKGNCPIWLSFVSQRVLGGNKLCLNIFHGRKFRQRRAKCMNGHPTLRLVST